MAYVLKLKTQAFILSIGFNAATQYATGSYPDIATYGLSIMKTTHHIYSKYF